jgi:hypothetical protein
VIGISARTTPNGSAKYDTARSWSYSITPTVRLSRRWY